VPVVSAFTVTRQPELVSAVSVAAGNTQVATVVWPPATVAKAPAVRLVGGFVPVNVTVMDTSRSVAVVTVARVTDNTPESAVVMVAAVNAAEAVYDAAPATVAAAVADAVRAESVEPAVFDRVAVKVPVALGVTVMVHFAAAVFEPAGITQVAAAVCPEATAALVPAVRAVRVSPVNVTVMETARSVTPVTVPRVTVTRRVAPVAILPVAPAKATVAVYDAGLTVSETVFAKLNWESLLLTPALEKVGVKVPATADAAVIRHFAFAVRVPAGMTQLATVVWPVGTVVSAPAVRVVGRVAPVNVTVMEISRSVAVVTVVRVTVKTLVSAVVIAALLLAHVGVAVYAAAAATVAGAVALAVNWASVEPAVLDKVAVKVPAAPGVTVTEQVAEATAVPAGITQVAAAVCPDATAALVPAVRAVRVTPVNVTVMDTVRSVTPVAPVRPTLTTLVAPMAMPPVLTKATVPV
jgi:hypothetical protein